MLFRSPLAIASDERPSGYDTPATPVPWVRRGLLVAGAALAYVGGRFVGDLWRNAVMDRFHHPPFRGSWVAVEHVFLYTTLSALFCWAVWWGFFRIGWMPSPGSVFRGPLRKVVVWGIGLGLVVFLFCLLALLVLHATGAMPNPPLAWHPMTGWSFLGNLFSNFYEEWIFRGFLFVVAIQVTSSRAAAAVLTTLASCWVLLKLRSLWPAWIAHQVVDLLGDSVFFG